MGKIGKSKRRLLSYFMQRTLKTCTRFQRKNRADRNPFIDPFRL
ncbi:hypothetical protein RRSWK_02500 [Rhodopirellula sp. SWK7]|nr:hypothetical protein RRSWK_02500 [Rhodopirellula sp. SWK7]